MKHSKGSDAPNLEIGSGAFQGRSDSRAPLPLDSLFVSQPIRPHWWDRVIVSAGCDFSMKFRNVDTGEVVAEFDDPGPGWCWSIIKVSESTIASAWGGLNIGLIDLSPNDPPAVGPGPAWIYDHDSHPPPPRHRRRTRRGRRRRRGRGGRGGRQSRRRRMRGGRFSEDASEEDEEESSGPQPRRVAQGTGHRSYVMGMCRVSNGVFASASEDRSIRLWSFRAYDDEQTDQVYCRRVFSEAHEDYVVDVEVVPWRDWLCSVGCDHRLCFHDYVRGRKVEWREQHTCNYTEVAVEESLKVVLACSRSVVNCWGLKGSHRKKPVRQIKLDGDAYSFLVSKFHPHRIIVGTIADLYFYDVRNLAWPTDRLTAATDDIYSIPEIDDRTFAVGSRDNTLTIWRWSPGSGGGAKQVNRSGSGANGGGSGGRSGGSGGTRPHSKVHEWMEEDAVFCATFLGEVMETNDRESAREDVLRRLRFLASRDEHFDMKLVFPSGKVVRLWRCLIVGSKRRDVLSEGRLDMSRDLDVDERELHAFLMGYASTTIRPAALLDYFLLFKELQFVSAMYVVCHQVLNCPEGSVLLDLWAAAKDVFDETTDPLDQSFKSAFSCAVWNAMKEWKSYEGFDGGSALFGSVRDDGRGVAATRGPLNRLSSRNIRDESRSSPSIGAQRRRRRRASGGSLASSSVSGRQHGAGTELDDAPMPVGSSSPIDSLVLRKRMSKAAEIALMSALVSFRPVDFRSHRNFAEEDTEDLPSDTVGLLRVSLRRLYKQKRRWSDVSLLSREREVHEAHLPILIIRSNFFNRMLHFHGAEFESLRTRREIDLSLSSEEIETLLQFYYRGDIHSPRFGVIMHLLVHGEMYQEAELLRVLHKRLSRATLHSVENGTLEEQLRQNGHVVRSLGCAKRIVDEWVRISKLSYDRIEELLRESERMAFVQELKLENDALRDRVGELESLVLSLVDRVQVLEGGEGGESPKKKKETEGEEEEEVGEEEEEEEEGECRRPSTVGHQDEEEEEEGEVVGQSTAPHGRTNSKEDTVRIDSGGESGAVSSGLFPEEDGECVDDGMDESPESPDEVSLPVIQEDE